MHTDIVGQKTSRVKHCAVIVGPDRGICDAVLRSPCRSEMPASLNDIVGFRQRRGAIGLRLQDACDLRRVQPVPRGHRARCTSCATSIEQHAVDQCRWPVSNNSGITNTT